jgi:hypothetical protein
MDGRSMTPPLHAANSSQQRHVDILSHPPQVRTICSYSSWLPELRSICMFHSVWVEMMHGKDYIGGVPCGPNKRVYYFVAFCCSSNDILMYVKLFLCFISQGCLYSITPTKFITLYYAVSHVFMCAIWNVIMTHAMFKMTLCLWSISLIRSWDIDSTRAFSWSSMHLV